MAKGPIVTDAVQAIIASVYQKHPKWKASMVRNEVSDILRKDNPKLPSGWPSLSIVQKVLAPVRKKMKERPVDPQDKPWSMATLDQYPISHEALPAVIEAWKHRAYTLTIREAKWVARFSAIPEKDLWWEAIQYAGMEYVYEQLIGQPFDSSKFDKDFIAGESTALDSDDWDFFVLVSTFPEDKYSVKRLRDFVKSKTKPQIVGRKRSKGGIK